MDAAAPVAPLPAPHLADALARRPRAAAKLVAAATIGPVRLADTYYVRRPIARLARAVSAVNLLDATDDVFSANARLIAREVWARFDDARRSLGAIDRAYDASLAFATTFRTKAQRVRAEGIAHALAADALVTLVTPGLTFAPDAVPDALRRFDDASLDEAVFAEEESEDSASAADAELLSELSRRAVPTGPGNNVVPRGAYEKSLAFATSFRTRDERVRAEARAAAKAETAAKDVERMKSELAALKAPGDAVVPRGAYEASLAFATTFRTREQRLRAEGAAAAEHEAEIARRRRVAAVKIPRGAYARALKFTTGYRTAAQRIAAHASREGAEDAAPEAYEKSLAFATGFRTKKERLRAEARARAVAADAIVRLNAAAAAVFEHHDLEEEAQVEEENERPRARNNIVSSPAKRRAPRTPEEAEKIAKMADENGISYDEMEHLEYEWSKKAVWWDVAPEERWSAGIKAHAW